MCERGLYSSVRSSCFTALELLCCRHRNPPCRRPRNPSVRDGYGTPVPPEPRPPPGWHPAAAGAVFSVRLLSTCFVGVTCFLGSRHVLPLLAGTRGHFSHFTA